MATGAGVVPTLTPPKPAVYESAGKLPPFTEFAKDVEAPGVLARIAEQISYKREIVLVCGDGSAYASPTALNTVLQFYALRVRHVLYMSDGPAACHQLRRAVPSLACAWSSILNTSKPAHDSVLVRKWWDMRFYFYNVRKHMLSRLAGELGYNVLQTDTDVAYFANPFPALKSGALGEHQLVVQPDLPLANAGVMYAQRIAPNDAAAWVLRELIDRIRAFSFHPELVPRILPWARPPYFSNADEQSLLNDCLTTAITQRTCFLFSTAIMEAKYGGNKGNRSFRFDLTPEAQLRKSLMTTVRARAVRLPYASLQCCHPDGLRVCTLPRSSKRNVTTFTSHVNSWPLGLPPHSATLSAAVATAASAAIAASAAAAATAATPPSTGAASASAVPPQALPTSRYAKAPNWLFQHYTHFDPRDAHKPQPRAAALIGGGGRASRGSVAAAVGGVAPAHGIAAAGSAAAATGLPDEPPPFGTFNGLPPVYMIHLAALRSGAWQRRAVLRAHGWWHPQADRLAADALGWTGRRGYLLLSSRSNVVRPGVAKGGGLAAPAKGGGSPGVTGLELDFTIGNLVLLAALSGRVPVIPEALCDHMTAPIAFHPWKETRRRRQERRCAWVPPKACWQLEYVTTLELQRAAKQNATLARSVKQAGLKAARNRTALPRSGTLSSSASAPSVKSTRGEGDGGLPRAARLASMSCDASAAVGQLLHLAPRSPASATTSPATTTALVMNHSARGGKADERALRRLQAVACEAALVAAIDDHAVDERIRRRRLRPAPSVARDPQAQRPQVDAKGKPIYPPGPWAWAGVDFAQLGAARGSAAVGEWLKRDAKCIDELLKLRSEGKGTKGVAKLKG